ncbi:MAG: energy transducer TonB [Syntrophales bacterium]
MSDGSVRGKRDGLSLNGMIFLSLLLHLALLSLLFFSPSFPSPKLTFGPVYNVSLVSLPQNVLEQKSSSTAATKELMSADRPETVVKKRLESLPAVPIRSLETRKKRDPDLEKAMEEIRKRAAATSAAKSAPAKGTPEKGATPNKTAGAAASPSPPGGAPGGAEMDAQMRAYYAAIWSRIKGKWALPQGILPGEVLEVVIDVTILRSGAVTEVSFEKRSGNRYFDESAMKAIQKASPLPPLPAWISGGSIGVGIRFHSSEMTR